MRPAGPSRATSSHKITSGFASSLVPFSLALVMALGVGGVSPAAAQEDYLSRRAAAQGQFERAEALRATLEAKTERERSVRDYQNLGSAYRRVYLITPRAAQVPSAIKNVADLYRRMGEQFEPKYFDSAIENYQFLIRDYPESKYREEALLAIAEIRKNNLSQPDLAQKNYEDFLQQYPRSSFAPQARKAIAQIQRDKIQAAEKANAPPEPAMAAGPRSSSLGTAAGGAAAGGTAARGAAAGGTAPDQDSQVSRVRIWNADNYTRIIIELGSRAKYQAARISDPDRIYFDIRNARLSNELLHRPIEIPPGGYLKAVRVAQNRSEVVRVVLDVAKVKDYSVFQLADPDRLVVDVYGPGASAKTTVYTPGTSAHGASASAAPASGSRDSAPPLSTLKTLKTARLETPPRSALGLLPLSP